MPTYISRITTHNQHELKISYKCDMLVVIIYGDLKMGGSYLFFLCQFGFACIGTNNVCCILPQLDVRLFWYIKHVCNHAIVVIWVLLRAVFSETKMLFSAFFLSFWPVVS